MFVHALISPPNPENFIRERPAPETIHILSEAIAGTPLTVLTEDWFGVVVRGKPDLFEALFGHRVESGKLFSAPISLRQPDGTEVPAHLSVSPPPVPLLNGQWQPLQAR